MFLFCRVFLSLYAGGGSVFCVLGGNSCLYEFVLFGVIFVWKNGGDYVMVIFTLVALIWELLCVSMSLSSTGNVCLRAI